MKKLFSLLCIFLGIESFAQNPDVFSFFGISYNLVSVVSNGDSSDMNGISLGGNIYKGLSENLYLDINPINLQLNFKSSTDYGVKTSAYMLSMKPSVGLAYRINFSDENVFLLPNAGFDIGAYLGGSSKVDKDNYDLFKDLGYNRFIFDWHAGINLCIKKIAFKVGYEGGIAPIYNKNDYKTRINQWIFGVAFDI